MKRLTIVKEDNIVGIDGVFYNVDCTSLPSNFHALQWYADYNQGEIEWNDRPKPPNTVITDLGSYSAYIQKWNDAKIANDAAMAALELQLTQNTSSNSA